MTLAAEAPDLDVLWGFRGPVTAFQHHRGITHTLIGAPFVAAATVACVWIFHRLRRHPPQTRPRWLLLWVFSMVAVLNHIFLDWTNNYGIRPFFPFNPRWYSLDIVFIFEPVIFAVLLLSLAIPAILRLADREIGARKTVFIGRGWAIFALCAAGLITVLRWTEHERAIDLARNLSVHDQPVVRCAAEPYMVNPFRWFVVTETQGLFQTGVLDTRNHRVEMNPEVLFKPKVTPAVVSAQRSWLGRVYLDWSKFPVVTDLGSAALLPPGDAISNPNAHVVEFRDLRFAYPDLPFGISRGSAETTGSSQSTAPPLTGWVYVSPSGFVDSMIMGGRRQN
jgi:inner membrane protein